MANHQRLAIRQIISAVSEIAEIVQELNPGQNMDNIKELLSQARGHLALALQKNEE